MQGDYHRYLAEFQESEAKKNSAEQARIAYDSGKRSEGVDFAGG